MTRKRPHTYNGGATQKRQSRQQALIAGENNGKPIYMDAKIIITDFKALKKWSCIPEDIQQSLLNNVFCGKCGETTIVDYSITADKYGILLKGKCKTCGNDVARLIENE